MYRQGSGARQSVRMGEMTPRRIKDFVFVHFNAFKSLMDRDMGLREEGWGTGEGRREGPCGCWSWRRKEKKKKKRKPELGYRRGTSTEKTDGESSEGDEKMKNKEWHQNIRRDSERSWHQRGMNTPTQPYFKVHFWGLLSFISSPSEEPNPAHHHNTISLQKSLQTSASSSTSSSVRFRLNQSVKWTNERRRWQKCLPK